ncbi:TlpA family protein disulfide reductase [Actinokineospora diospyrosa]|uniref:Thiol-disulfide isomerase or thioredoxin n=1 Tax=Actinokineospora diospyrosa TaxID=103728 RepID=A0ABT1IED9_9PSEU|nr:TlpA disulfide reductase family protein [Actinokineospora diospyrosa]MCP2270691.1 Thiol-disulfide isomerase or thioredoxin [Actinokineospora diospyrosa]
MTTTARWVLVAVILVVAATVALWPRGSDPAPARPGPDLTAERTAAALKPCPTGSGAPGLAEASAECLSDGTRVTAGNVFGGRPVLVNVWATWCMPCRDELPLLAEYAAGPGAVEVIGVAVQSSDKDALELLAALGVRFPNLLDRDGQVQRGLRVPDALPASYLVAADGTATLITQPRLFRSVDDVRSAVDSHVSHVGGGR